jgi:glycosyltransferase involved in cell wall biosynthesis
MSSTPTVSIAIPALNEAANIERCLTSIRSCFPQGLELEILVGDHGSVDGTPAIAAAQGARVVPHRGGTVGGLRNVIASHCSGSVLVFLDADTTVTPEWGAGMSEVVLDLQRRPAQITGSMCSVPDVPSAFIRYWFAKIPRVTTEYLGTAHLIVPAALFHELGGFDPALRSGEDFDFCERARQHGAALVVRSDLKVVHHDYPLTAGDFLRRECWHGSGDFQSLDRMLHSRVALAALLFMGIQLAALLALLLAPAWFLGLEALTVVLALGLSVLKFRKLGIGARLANVGIFYLYLIGRAGSALSVWKRKLTPQRAPIAP